MKNFITWLEKLYFLLFLTSLFLIIITTHIIRSDINITKNIIIKEEYLESFVILVLFLIGYMIFRLYQREMIKKEHAIKKAQNVVKRSEEQLSDAIKYIGQVNVQIQEIQEAIVGLKKFPEAKKDLKNVIDFLTEKVLALINANWVLLRIVDVNNLRTLREYAQTRSDSLLIKHKIANKVLIEGGETSGYKIITSEQSNLGLKAYFIFPAKKISKEQRVLIQAIASELEMIYIIFNSKYYKKIDL